MCVCVTADLGERVCVRNRADLGECVCVCVCA